MLGIKNLTTNKVLNIDAATLKKGGLNFMNVSTDQKYEISFPISISDLMVCGRADQVNNDELTRIENINMKVS